MIENQRGTSNQKHSIDRGPSSRVAELVDKTLMILHVLGQVKSFVAGSEIFSFGSRPKARGSEQSLHFWAPIWRGRPLCLASCFAGEACQGRN